MPLKKPTYDFNHQVFKQNFLYKRLAKEHISLAELESDVIDIEILQTRGEWRVPEAYRITYKVNSITGLDADRQPIYGDTHIADIIFPLNYPIEPPQLKMQTKAWHPNIKSEGKFEGRICGNIKDFGRGYDLYQLVMRIGEILQYKNYHATNVAPYPEDIKAAAWVLEYAEPKGIVNKEKGIATDYQELTRRGVELNVEVGERPKTFEQQAAAKTNVETSSILDQIDAKLAGTNNVVSPTPPTDVPTKPRIVIGGVKPPAPQPPAQGGSDGGPRKITITRK
jgi:ubiquitin-protein ligase